MWIVTIQDDDQQEIYEVFIADNEEMQDLFDYIKMSPNLALISMESRFIIPGFDALKETIEGKDI